MLAEGLFPKNLKDQCFITGKLQTKYKVYNEQHPKAGQNTQHVLYGQQARAGRNT